MDCNEARELLPAHLDRQLDVPESSAIEGHLKGCPACRSEYVAQSRVSAQIRGNAMRFDAPPGLAARIAAALPQEKSARKPGINLGVGFNWLNLGALTAAVLAVAWSAGIFLAQPSTEERLADEVVAGHVRSLMANHIADVASSDRHTVKPWFNGKLDFSPPVSDLASEGFPLIGGRLDYLHGRTVAALVYRHGQHPINLYVWPSADSAENAKSLSRNGYHVIHWIGNGMAYWAISDLAVEELNKFVGILQSQAPAPAG
jgi:anti-sigma factor RsiW